jgi:D-3-phosphoglycerate dehydrogenase
MGNVKSVWILDDEGLNHEREIELYHKHGIKYRITTKKSFTSDLKDFGTNADAIVAQVGFQCPSELIVLLEKCKIICTFGMGFNHVDLKTAADRNIYVCNVPDYCAEEVSDHTLALSLTLLRKLFDYNNNVKNGIWDPTNTKPIHRLSHTTVGLLGFGQIARMVADRFKSFGIAVIAHDKFVDQGVFEQHEVTSVSLDKLLDCSNLLSLHVPLTKETKNLLDEKKLRKLPSGAILVNTCRGGIVNEEALVKLIKKKHISGVGLDVLEEEPPKRENELIQMGEVIITPHAAYYSVEAEEQMQTDTALNIIRVLRNEKPKNIVNGI